MTNSGGYANNAEVKAAYDAAAGVTAEQIDQLLKEKYGFTETESIWFAAASEAAPSWYIGQYGDYLFAYYGMCVYLNNFRQIGYDTYRNTMMGWGGWYSASNQATVAAQGRNSEEVRKILYVAIQNPRDDVIGFSGADDRAGTTIYGHVSSDPHAKNSDGGDFRYETGGQNGSHEMYVWLKN